MPEKIEPKDLEQVLARLKNEWRELAALLTSQGMPQERVIEVQKILLRDASGQYRGKMSVEPDGSAQLLLSDHEGSAWARLGVNQQGEAFLELKDKNGESSFKVAVGAPSPGVAADLAAPPAEAPTPSPVAPSTSVSSPPAADSDTVPAWDAEFGVIDPLVELQRQNVRQKYFSTVLLVIMGVILAIQTYMLFRPSPSGVAVEALVVRDANGRLRASLEATGDKVRLDLWDTRGRRRAYLGLGAEGSPSLAFYDQNQQVRAELNLGPDGEPQFTLRDKRSLQGKTAPNVFGESGQHQPGGGAVSGSEEGTVACPPAAPVAAVAPKPAAETEVEFVGSKTSNKYHYPTCKWARTIQPGKLIKFKSAADAQARHYKPCPVCKPPPLSR
jgi:hypothetical protein